MDRICDYDEGYDREDAYEIGWCYKCGCNPKCPYKKKAEKDVKKVRYGGFADEDYDKN